MDLKEIRKSYGFSQAEFAKKLNVSRSTYIKYEVGEKDPEEIEGALKLYIEDRLLENTGVKGIGIYGKEFYEALAQVEQAEYTISKIADKFRAMA